MLAAYSIMDIFIHAPIAYDEEAFGLVYLEAMASAIPCIFTISGISGSIIKIIKMLLLLDIRVQ